jgi:hypothetical protein
MWLRRKQTYWRHNSHITKANKDAVGAILNGLVSSFSWVLMLLMGFTMPVVEAEGAEYICYLMTNNGLSTVTDKFEWGTALDEVIIQCVEKLFLSGYQFKYHRHL